MSHRALPVTRLPSTLPRGRAGLVIIPVQPSAADVWASDETVDLINEGRVFNEMLKSVIVINRKIVNTVIGRGVRDVLKTLDTRILRAELSQRVAFAEAFAVGTTVHALDPASRAEREIEAFIDELTEEA